MPVVNREVERRIYEEAKKQGKDDAFIKEAITRYRERELAKQGQTETKPNVAVAETEPDGFFKSIVKGALKPAVTLALRPSQAVGAMFGASPENQELDVPFFGKVGTSKGGRDVVRDIGRGLETVSLGVGGGAAKETAKAGFKAAGWQALKKGFLGGAKAGAIGGAGASLEDSAEGESVGSTLANAGIVAGAGAAGAGILGGLAGGSAAMASKVARKGVEKVARNTDIPILSKIKENTLMKDALEITEPILNKDEQVSAIARGRAKETGISIFKKVKPTPGPKEIEIAKSVKNLVKKGASELDNINNINAEVTKINSAVENGLKQNDTIFNQKQLRSRLNQAKEESRVIFGSDKTLESRYDAAIDEIFKHIKKNNLSGLLEARKNFDAVIRQKFPRTFVGDASDNVTKNAILDIRREVNDFIADHLPRGNQFRDQLKQEHLMLRAVEALAERAQMRVPKSRTKLNTLLSTIGVLSTGAGILGTGAYFGSKLSGGR